MGAKREFFLIFFTLIKCGSLCKLFDVKTEEILFSIQSKAANPPAINKASKMYTQTLVDEIKKLGLGQK